MNSVDDKVLMFLVLFPIVTGGVYFVFYGISGGLIAKRILTNKPRNLYVTGGAAIRRGILYIIIGSIMLVVTALAILKEFSVVP